MELLSPAGHYEAMVAAVQCGADAVYLGFGDHNARRGARNFSREDFARALAYCHLRGVRVYLTMNTLLSDRELPAALEELRFACRLGVDAAILQDWGLLRLCRQALPDLPLHASTQMTIHNRAGVAEAAALGLRCAVLGRELSREDIAAICQDSPATVEVFVHGALCMCWSGQCAMSAMIGQRSGNRGMCAQPCRLPYRFDGGETGYPLSLKDAALCGRLGELEAMGVDSLKIEGRMKRPEYVALVTGIYARLLRERRSPTAEERRQLAAAFSRDGFTEGYYQGRLGPEMFGTRSGQEAKDLFAAARAAYERENLRLTPVTLSCRIRAGQAACLTAADGDGHRTTALGPVPEAARSRSLTAQEVEQRLGKTGGTAFRCERVSAEVEEGLALSAGALNALRREALDALAALRTAPPERRERPLPEPPEDGCAVREIAFTVSLSHGLQLTCELLALSPAVVYLPVERIDDFDLLPSDRERYPDTEFCAALPRICRDSEERDLLRLLERAKEKGCTSLSVQNIGQVRLGQRLGLKARGDFGLNIFNSHALAQCRDWGLRSACLSFELRREQLRDLRKCLPCEAIVYGRLPLMVTENCLAANAGRGCGAASRRGESVPCREVHTLTDRRGESFPVLPVFGCRSELENGKTLYLADRPDFRRLGLAYGRLRFTTETPADCAALLRQYLGRTAAAPPEGLTRGLFYRGVE